MNLTKSFNWNFLKQNIKKSKGGIILSIIIVPLIISLYMVTDAINSNSLQIISHDFFGNMNLFFMYIIPFVYSVFLFGFVFKKPSTDFMNSMPINRKTMFITNTIGGIGLITIIQLLSAFTILFWGGIFGNLVVFPMDVLETMLLSWCSYVFVFISANLAMTISGTLMTQIVVTVLILFLIPFCSEEFEVVKSINGYRYYGYDDVRQNYDLSITDGYEVTHYNLMKEIKDYTMPFKFPRYGFKFSEGTIIKMLALSAVYFVIGLKLYEKRKMEDNEESFGSVKLHIIVKALTLIPILLLANFTDLSENITAFIVIVILSAIYYFIFDLIVKRKVPIKVTVLSFVLTIFIIQASISTISVMSKEDAIDIDYEDIKSISVGKNSNSTTGLFLSSYYYDNNNLVFDGNHFSKDSELLDMILDAKSNVENESKDDNYLQKKNLYFNIKLKSGKEYYFTIYIYEKDYDKIIKYLVNNEQYISNLKDNIISNSGVYLDNNQIVDNKTKKIINREIKNNLENIDFSSLDRNTDVYFIEKKVYKDHEIYTYKIPSDLSSDTLKAVAEFSNISALNNIKGYRYSMSATVYNKSKMVGNISDEKELLEFMEENANEEFDPSKSYYIISGGLQTTDGYKTFIYYTNKTKIIDNNLF